VYPDAQPRIYKARTVSLLHRELVERELNDLQMKGIITPLQFSTWATLVVLILKKNGKM